MSWYDPLAASEFQAGTISAFQVQGKLILAHHPAATSAIGWCW